jgi:hypothetical protein
VILIIRGKNMTAKKTKPAKKKERTKPKVIYKPIPKHVERFNKAVSIFSGELGIDEADLKIILRLLFDLFQSKSLRVPIFENPAYKEGKSNLYLLRYKIENLLHGKSK